MSIERPLEVSDDVTIDVAADVAHAAVADPSMMGRWSPENRGATIATQGSPAPAGTVFVGHNRRGRARWSTRCVVTACDPGERFAFDVVRIGKGPVMLPAAIASWEYRFETLGPDRTRVVETWRDNRRWSDARAARFDRIVTGGRLFHEFQARNIRRTLDRLKSDLEGGR